MAKGIENMSFGQNLQALRKLHNGMTQEALAEKMNVSRQTVSKWESDDCYPEMDKALELSKLFHCTLDHLFRESIGVCGKACSDIRVEETAPFRYFEYTVVSREPEDDALSHVKRTAQRLGIAEPEVIGWDFPCLSQDQINVHHMHGYTAACILPDDWQGDAKGVAVLAHQRQKYCAITVKDPFRAPFFLIPGAYQTLMDYMRVNGIAHRAEKGVIPCFEKCRVKDGVDYMDICIAAAL